jgi:Stress responsive A/B Barrel Domain
MAEDRTRTPVAHTVYFSLHDTSPPARARLIAAAQELLSGHDGVLHFSVGTLAEGLSRPVNVRDFEVSLHFIFEHMAAHDLYQTHPRHLRFMAENRANWKAVRVFDSNVAP